MRNWTLAAAVLLAGSIAMASDIRDDAGMFKATTVREAEQALAKVQRETKVPIVIDTIASLNGELPDTVGARRASKTGRARCLYPPGPQGEKSRHHGGARVHPGLPPRS